MFGNGRARSGIIVLPCGAGKTQTAVAASTVKRRFSTMYERHAVSQWKARSVDDAARRVSLFTAKSKKTCTRNAAF